MTGEKTAAIRRAAELHTAFLAMVALRRHWGEPDHDGALTALAWELAAAHRAVTEASASARGARGTVSETA